MTVNVVQALVGEQLVRSGQLAAQQVLGPSPPYVRRALCDEVVKRVSDRETLNNNQIATVPPLRVDQHPREES